MDHDLNYVIIHVLARPGTQSECTASTYRNALRSVGITDLEGLVGLQQDVIDGLRLKPAERNRVASLSSWIREHQKPLAWKNLTTEQFDAWCLRNARKSKKRRSPWKGQRKREPSRERKLLEDGEINSSQSSSTSSSGKSFISISSDDDEDVERGLFCARMGECETPKVVLIRMIPIAILLGALIGMSVFVLFTVPPPSNFITTGVLIGIFIIACTLRGPRGDDEYDEK